MKSANAQKKKNDLKIRRHRRVRAKIFGTANCPRFSVFRSAKHITAQLIDDVTGKTLVSAQDGEVEKKKDGGKVAVAKALGALVAERAKTKKIVKVVFDRSSYKYHGRVQALALGAREGGLEF